MLAGVSTGGKLAAVGLGAVAVTAGYGAFRAVASGHESAERKLQERQAPYRELAGKLHAAFPTHDYSEYKRIDAFKAQHALAESSVHELYQHRKTPGTSSYRVIVDNHELLGGNPNNRSYAIAGAGLAGVLIAASHVSAATNAGLASRIGAATPLLMAAVGSGLMLGAMTGEAFTGFMDRHSIIYPSGETRPASADRALWDFKGTEPLTGS